MRESTAEQLWERETEWLKRYDKDGDSGESGRLLIESSDEDRSGVREDDQLSGEGDCLTGWTGQGKE